MGIGINWLVRKLLVSIVSVDFTEWKEKNSSANNGKGHYFMLFADCELYVADLFEQRSKNFLKKIILFFIRAIYDFDVWCTINSIVCTILYRPSIAIFLLRRHCVWSNSGDVNSCGLASLARSRQTNWQTATQNWRTATSWRTATLLNVPFSLQMKDRSDFLWEEEMAGKYKSKLDWNHVNSHILLPLHG